jgi:hypothetical protein
MLKSENVTPNTGINSGFNGIGITGGPSSDLRVS